MAYTPVTIEEILETLPPEEKEELLRTDFKGPLELYLLGYNRNPVCPRDEILTKFRNWAKRRNAVKQTVARNPAISQTEFKDPIVIIGMARSGTTLLHRLLLTDPQFIAPMFWEMIEPLPPGRPENWTECERFKRAQNDAELAGFVDGALDKLHYVRMESEEECFLITRQYFFDLIDCLPNPYLTELREFMYNFPEDHATNTYEYLKMFYQCLFYGNMTQGKRLMIKCPLHCLYLDTLRKVFPGAKLIFPYRSGKSMVASYSSFVNEMWKIHSRLDDSHGSGQRVTELFKHSSSRVVKYLKQLPQEEYMTIPYTKMVKDPLETVTQIYSHFKLDLRPEAEAEMQRYMQENYQHKHGKPSYTPERYGITDEVIKENMKEYLDYFADSG